MPLACGDSGRETAEGSATLPMTTVPTTTPTTGEPTTSGSATDTETGPDDGTASQSGTSTGAPETESDSDSSTGGPKPFCDVDPPPGFQGPFDAACANEPQIGKFDPIVEWHKDTFTMSPGANASASAPIVVQVDDDNGDGKVDDQDMPDILNIMYDPQNQGVLRAISGDGSKEVLGIVVPGGTRDEGLAAADIDGDGFVEIVTGTNIGQQILCYEHDGTLKWTSPQLGVASAGMYENLPSIVDMNGDGKPEIVVGRAILNSAGNLVGQGMYGIGAPTGNDNGSASVSFGVDLDGDGKGEVVVGNAVYRMDGTAIWFSNQNDGYPATADLDLDGVPEIIVVSDANVRAQQSSDGAVLWSTAIPGGKGGPPTVADFDGDGLPEVGIAGSGQYSVFDTDGSVLWSRPTQDNSSGITGSSVYDFEGDGVADVVYADEINLYVFSGLDGATKLEFADHNSGTRLEYPIVADVDNDGYVV
jgi:hypothetical protein